eukprot:m.5885 g.5885  ORF g.5885 m.5885 type:complete len:284 (+) comp14361_c0_seq2:28-879(+)
MDAVSQLLGGLTANQELELMYKICWILLAFFSITFFLLTVVGMRAPYGRYARADAPKTPLSQSKMLGFTMNAKLGWTLQELPSFLIPLAYILLVNPGESKVNRGLNANLVLLGCFLLHYSQRSVIYPCLIRGTSPTKLGAVFLAFILCTVNGYLQGCYLTRIAEYPSGWLTQWNFVLGVPMFLLGWMINIHSDHILRNLRKPGETGYKIPKGGMFEFVSGANFLGEIVEWTGYSLAGWSFVTAIVPIFTVLNLIPRALHHHQNYHEKFEDYPKNRKAVFPYIL